jgi:spoIIIJ-associated protein
MAKGKDFYGTVVTEVIAKACKEMSVSQEELDIEVLETGSAGIFGLCKKKAHIRVTRKMEKLRHPEGKIDKAPEEEREPVRKTALKSREGKKEFSDQEHVASAVKENAEKQEASQPDSKLQQPSDPVEKSSVSQSTPRELPSSEVLETIQEDLSQLLALMDFPSKVTVKIEDSGVACRISSEHQDALVGNEGRTLDSLQYLLRKMMSRRLPDRMMLSLDVGHYREQRAEDLKKRALELAEQVKAEGKTLAIPALNPSERRVVHMILQEDKAIRSRSVGEGLFKKVLIYKPGKKKKSGSRRGKGRQGGRSSGKQ